MRTWDSAKAVIPISNKCARQSPLLGRSRKRRPLRKRSDSCSKRSGVGKERPISNHSSSSKREPRLLSPIDFPVAPIAAVAAESWNVSPRSALFETRSTACPWLRKSEFPASAVSTVGEVRVERPYSDRFEEHGFALRRGPIGCSQGIVFGSKCRFKPGIGRRPWRPSFQTTRPGG